MNECVVARMLLSTLVRRCIGYTENPSSLNKLDKSTMNSEMIEGCHGFLCAGSACDRSGTDNFGSFPSSLSLYSIAYISANTFMNPLHVVIPALKHDENWSNYLDRQQVKIGR